MSLATLVGAVIAYPVNVWLVAVGLKHGMGTVRVLGAGGHNLEAEATRIPATSGEQPLGLTAAMVGHAMTTAQHAPRDREPAEHERMAMKGERPAHSWRPSRSLRFLPLVPGSF